VSTHYELAPLEYELSREGHMQRRRREIVAGAIAQLGPVVGATFVP
jgi:hypothetical protein